MVLYRTVSACANCTLKYLSTFLDSTYGHRKTSGEGFTALLSSCGSSPTEFPHSIVTFGPIPTTTKPQPSCLGSAYTVQPGDTCTSISNSKSVAVDRFLSDNSFEYNCEDLVAGSSVCIGDRCALQTVIANQTCKDILLDKPFTITEMMS